MNHACEMSMSYPAGLTTNAERAWWTGLTEWQRAWCHQRAVAYRKDGCHCGLFCDGANNCGAQGYRTAYETLRDWDLSNPLSSAAPEESEEVTIAALWQLLLTPEVDVFLTPELNALNDRRFRQFFKDVERAMFDEESLHTNSALSPETNLVLLKLHTLLNMAVVDDSEIDAVMEAGTLTDLDAVWPDAEDSDYWLGPIQPIDLDSDFAAVREVAGAAGQQAVDWAKTYTKYMRVYELAVRPILGVLITDGLDAARVYASDLMSGVAPF